MLTWFYTDVESPCQEYLINVLLHIVRFRSCLKQANTAASNLVGKLFFNIIQIKYNKRQLLLFHIIQTILIF